MLNTPKIECYLQAGQLTGKDDKKMVRLLFYITKLTHVLAVQLSPEVADLLFKQDGSGKPHPTLVTNEIPLELGNIPLQLMEMHPLPDPKMDHLGVMMKGVQLSNFTAKKLYPDDPNFSLIFRAEIPKDKLAMEMLDKYYGVKVFLSFEEMQTEMFTDPKKTPTCEQCEDPSVAKDSTGAYLCQKHVSKGVGKIEWLLKKESPKEAAKRAVAEAQAKSKAAGAGKEDMSHANRQKGGKTKRK